MNQGKPPLLISRIVVGAGEGRIGRHAAVSSFQSMTGIGAMICCNQAKLILPWK